MPQRPKLISMISVCLALTIISVILFFWSNWYLVIFNSTHSVSISYTFAFARSFATLTNLMNSGSLSMPNASNNCLLRPHFEAEFIYWFFALVAYCYKASGFCVHCVWLLWLWHGLEMFFTLLGAIVLFCLLIVFAVVQTCRKRNVSL